ncbi:sigma-70 family RNA polymerase sigma factor [Litoribrevibacter euphylliae]|uniref:Sigma-70 family RNA polymerase sigma factor n=1 Tax=Litoribrevibacter euphylliae TaxID=1834034 RepID=A0ABV7HHI6_9GAMM
MSSAILASDQERIQLQIHELYNEHAGWLFSWLRGKLGCSYQAQDLSHDTFERLLKKQQLLDLCEPKAFLTVVAKRVLSNHWRREQLERVYLDVLAEMPESFAPSEEERGILLETLTEIDRLLDGLPVPVKQAFLYAQLDGMTHQQIAETLNVSVSTVKRYLVRAGAHCYFAIQFDFE